jgi:DNA-binding LacI/PurR family transcriptional regulator
MLIDAVEGRRPDKRVVDLGFELIIRESSAPRGAQNG